MLKYSSVTKKLITKSQNLSKLSSKSLFHFTESIENVISILAEGFRHSIIKKDLPLPTYSSSNFNLPGIIKNEFRFKAVCFCDIPLRHINNHKQQYGEYAIGLNKNWAILNGITPVRYVHYYTPDLKNNVFNITRDIAERNFITKHKVINVINEILEDEGSKERVSSDDIEDCPEKIKLLISGYNDLLVAICNHFYSHYGLMRKYEDEWTDRVKGEKRKKTFYDEREWRSINNGDKGNLKFSASAISKILVNNNNERKQVLDFFKDHKEKYQIGTIAEVESKVVIFEQIMEDF